METIDYNEGAVILIDKPTTWTSFDVVKKLKFALKVKKIGHAGTLDPLATGLLVICTGKFTKKIDTYQNDAKEYICELTFGKTTPSIDLETDFDGEYPYDHINNENLQTAIASFIGEISQTPPIYSAIKIDGKRAYTLARKGLEAEIKSRLITIYSIDILSFENPILVLRIACSKGTYIRSLVRDLGEKLHSGAYMSNLRRTKIGDFDVANAKTIQDFVKINTTTLPE